MTAKLTRVSPQDEGPELAGNIGNCQWCNKPLQPENTVWYCDGELSRYLVCDECHGNAEYRKQQISRFLRGL